MVVEAHRAQPSLGKVAHQRIRADILSCKLAPGDRVTERGLAKDLGLGLAPIRDALTRLDHEGLVRTIPRKGYQVTPLTVKSIDDLFGYWAVFGPELLRVGVIAATDEQVEQAIDIAKGLSKLTMRDRSADDVALHAVEEAERYYEILVSATGNEYLIDAHRRTIGQIQRVWTFVIESELLEQGRRIADFDGCIEAMQARDADALASWMRHHIESSRARVMKALTRWPSVLTSELTPLRGAEERD